MLVRGHKRVDLVAKSLDFGFGELFALTQLFDPCIYFRLHVVLVIAKG